MISIFVFCLINEFLGSSDGCYARFKCYQTKLNIDPEKDKFDPSKVRQMPCAWRQCTTTTVTHNNVVGALLKWWAVAVTAREQFSSHPNVPFSESECRKKERKTIFSITIWCCQEKKMEKSQSSERTLKRIGAQERSEQLGASEWVSGARIRANGGANGTVLNASIS